MLVEAFVAQPPVEALDVGILHGLAGIDEVQLHPMGVSPSVQDPPGEFRAVVYGDQLRRFCQNSGLSRHGGKLTQTLGPG